MLFFYEQSAQLWRIDVDPSNNLFLDQMTFGILATDFSPVTQFYGGLIVPTEIGYRSVTLSGTNFDSMRDLGLGEPIADFFPLAIRDTTFWPHMGIYVSSVVDDSEDWFHIFNFSRQAKISAWSRWQVNALGTPNKNGLVPIAERLYVVVGSDISYFDATATSFRDANDVVDTDAYESLAVFHFNDFRRPGDNKRLIWIDWAVQGETTYGFLFSPQDFDVEWREIVSAETDITYGLTRIPLGYLVVPGVAPALRSVDETGWRLDQISIDFQYLRRY